MSGRRVMRRLATVFFVAVLVVLAAPTAFADKGGTDLPFRVHGSGTLSAAGPFSGTVQGTHIGKGTFSGSFVFIGPPILPCSAGSNVPNFTRVQTLTAANGDTINQTTVGTVCQSGPTTFPAEETYTIVGGTGRFSTATGSGHQTSFADFSNGFGNPATYTFTQDGTISFNH
jgi:hypothetical protein